MDKEKVRILFLITDLGKGGAERLLIDICKELSTYNEFEIIIGSLFHNNQYFEETTSFNVVNLNYQTYSLLGSNDFTSYKKILEKFKPHIIHTHRFLAEFLSSFYVQENIKYFCHLHDNMVQLKRLTLKTIFNKEQLINYIERSHLINKKYKKVNTTFLSISKDTSIFLNKNTKDFKSDTKAIPNSINFKKFYNAISDGVKSKKIKLINIGSFHHENKNQLFLIEIAKELLKSNLDFEINIFGDGSLKKVVERKVSDNKLNDYFIFHGNVNNVEEYLKQCHIYIHTATSESFGLVLLEAMASGLPVVSLDAKGNRDFINHGINGYIIKEQNPKLFSVQIIKLSSDKDLYIRIAEKGQGTARKYDIKEYTKNLINIYQNSLMNN